MSRPTMPENHDQSNAPADNQTLTQRALNRMLLARQLLLRRHAMPAIEAIEQLAGMQSQAPLPPYVGLWTRLDSFRQAELATALVTKQAVRLALMRSTIHLVSARDSLWLRPCVQPVLERGLSGTYGKQLQGLDLEAVAAASRALVEAKPRTFSELGEALNEVWPERDPQALSSVARTLLALVQVPPRGLWGASGRSLHTTVEHWLGHSLSPAPAAEVLICRYLTAFGPASVKDMQVWSGLNGLRQEFERIRPQLCRFHDEHGVELFDLPGAPRPEPETTAPPRFLPAYDNILLSHADRTRIIATEYRSRVFTKNGIIRPTILIDGVVAGTWQVSQKRDMATLTIAPFQPLSVADRRGLEAEGSRLLDFAASTAAKADVRFEPLH